MASLVTRTIEWIDEAPMRIDAHASSAATPDEVFALLADHERWPEWFPAVRKVTVLGPAEGVGARRRVHIPGAFVDEEFIVWEPGERWAFTGYAARPRFTTSLVEDCRLDALAAGGTDIVYTMYLDPPARWRPLVELGVERIRANNTRALHNLATRAAGLLP